MGTPLSGFVFGIVTSNDDPDGTGRVKALIPGLVEPMTSYWIMPYGIPSGKRQQPRPPDIGHDIAIMFQYGDYMSPEAKAIYLTGYAGVDTSNESAGPTVNASVDDPRDVNCIYEDDKFQIYIEAQGKNASESGYTRRLVLQTKTRGTRVEIDAAAGETRKSEGVLIEGATFVSLYTPGQMDLRANLITINGRPVADRGGEI